MRVSLSLLSGDLVLVNSPVPLGLSSVNSPRQMMPSLMDTPMPSFLLSWKNPQYSSPLLRSFHLPYPCFLPILYSPSQNYTPSYRCIPLPSRRLFVQFPSNNDPAFTSVPLPLRMPSLKLPMKVHPQVECRPNPCGSPSFQLPEQY